MRWMRSAVAGLVAVVGVAGSAAPTASADLLAPGTKFIDASVVLRAGAFDDYVDHLWVVAEGDTLDAIARTHYGEPARVADLRRANPEVVPERLAIGQKLLLPPKRAAVAGSTEAIEWRFRVWSPRHRFADAVLTLPGEPFRSHKFGFFVFAYAADREADFAKLIAAIDAAPDRYETFESLTAPAAWLSVSERMNLRETIDHLSPVESILTTLELREFDPKASGAKRWRFVVAATEQRDAKGQLVASGGSIGDAARGGPGAARLVALLAISLAGALALLLLCRRGALRPA
ncbi:MAG: LysM peptidoglycan-binding domain-containing protein [Planctomycetes bacterium]|nr:LysM peptidoglycan-binding domain-containing protein [Planctomycetota bacterium]